MKSTKAKKLLLVGVIISVVVGVAYTGVSLAATTIGTNISTTGTLSSGAATVSDLTVSGSTTFVSGSIALSALADDADTTKVLTAGGSGGDPNWAAVSSTPEAGSIGATELADTVCSQVLAVRPNPDESLAVDYISLAPWSTGVYSHSTTESNVDAFNVPTTMTAHHLMVTVDAAPGEGKTWDITLRDDAASTALTRQITGVATTCSDVTHTITTIAAGSKLDVLVSAGGSPANVSQMTLSLPWSVKS